jgi:hypothetical protein
MWTHNDSGDDPVIYCIRAMGRPCGAWRLTGASAFDWEDIAWGPGPGTGYLYVGDIGDNLRVRSEIVIYRVPEPEVSDVAGPGLFETAPSEALRFTYPGAQRDAETLLVDPITDELYVITKEVGGRGVVFRSRDHRPGSLTVLERVGRLRPQGLLPGPTGGDISFDGRWVVLATYGGAQEAQRPSDGSLERPFWAGSWARFDPGRALQREAIAYDTTGMAVISTSEGVAAPISRVQRRSSRGN